MSVKVCGTQYAPNKHMNILHGGFNKIRMRLKDIELPYGAEFNCLAIGEKHSDKRDIGL